MEVVNWHELKGGKLSFLYFDNIFHACFCQCREVRWSAIKKPNIFIDQCRAFLCASSHHVKFIDVCLFSFFAKTSNWASTHLFSSRMWRWRRRRKRSTFVLHFDHAGPSLKCTAGNTLVSSRHYHHLIPYIITEQTHNHQQFTVEALQLLAQISGIKLKTYTEN